ncbi:lambda exonuclease family protein [Rhizorhapis suberifaciens]|uniref:YqaJ viral recombinase domain-containing protein n=1 Tax=Rhizorhapis suberifaciens TaxID=13656 RepID=A0A840HVL7_9SPHN|nr:YqaJ viral recombinase family protein [Rhizorhapis suberifaciens]MBB4642332.1 hypothetical protein [Rhizorhapis suberifaciens]
MTQVSQQGGGKANNLPLAGSHITYHKDLIQGSDEWLAERCGLLTASEMKLIITPTLKVADNDKTRAHLYELLGQRITGYVEPHYISDDMLRGRDDETEARMLYHKNFAPVKEIGFITNDKWGFTIGYSPDALVGDDGLIECKSRRQKYQVQTIVENVGVDKGETIPADYVIQCQTGMLVTERAWCDLVSYSGGLPMAVMRVHADPVIQEAIETAAAAFEAKLADKLAIYEATVAARKMIATERRVEQEMFV